VTLLLGTLWPLVFAPLVWAVMRFGVIAHEEAHLLAKFGDEYRAYQARVRRWL
jgi:protein-S-isoprenylcysteine O-methyltransferase Ste14